jgi:hypothetical protein
VIKPLRWYVVPCAGLLAIAGSGCATTREQTSIQSPAERRVQATQEQAEQALEEARAAQRKATEQSQRAAAVQQQVHEAQQRLIEAQRKSQAEHTKAQQLQREANQATQRASELATPAQKQALAALVEESARVARGEETMLGQVKSASADQLVITSQEGQSMTFDVTDRTLIRIDGRTASAAEIQQGDDARVSYQFFGTQPMAVTVQTMTGKLRRQPSETGTEPPQEPQERGGQPPPDSGSPQGSERN